MRCGLDIQQRSGAAGLQPRPFSPCYWATLHLPGALRVLRARDPEIARGHWPVLTLDRLAGFG
jgi:hypothetical protein